MPYEPVGDEGRGRVDALVQRLRDDVQLDQRLQDRGVGLDEPRPQRVVLQDHAFFMNQGALEHIYQSQETLVARAQY